MNNLFEISEVIRSLTLIVCNNDADGKVKLEANKKLIEVIKLIKIKN
jgi:hypothetical protein